MEIDLDVVKNIPEIRNKISNFDWIKYFILNPDLLGKIKYDEYSATNHYLSHGYYDGRKCNFKLPNNFKWKSYVKKNPDLTRAGIKTKPQAIRHWLNHGQKENRIF